MGIFLQYAPYTLRDANWDDMREPFGKPCFSILSNNTAPGFRSLIVEKQVLTPLDLERRFSLTGGEYLPPAR